MNEQERSERLFELLGNMDDSFIDEARPTGGKKRINIWKYAAGIAAVAAAGIIIWQGGGYIKRPDIDIDRRNPDITVQTDDNNSITSLEPIVLSPDTNTSPADEAMPEPFSGNGNSTGGDENAMFYSPIKQMFDGIDSCLYRLRSENEITAWINAIPRIYTPGYSDLTKLTDSINIYSYIKKFEITDEEAETAYAYALDSGDSQLINRNQLDIILHGSEEEVASLLANEYAIVIGSDIYSPWWVYLHSADDYKAVGITPEMIEEKLELYDEIGLSSEAASAFAEKLTNFTGKQVQFLRSAYTLQFIDYDNLPFKYEQPESLSTIRARIGLQGMGYEGMYAYDVSELISGNPWTPGMNITELPVFTGCSRYELFTIDDVLPELERIASVFGEELTDVYFDTANPDYFPPEDRDFVEGKSTVLKAKAGNVSFTVFDDCIDVYIAGDGLTDGYAFDLHDKDIQSETYMYLAQKYSDIIGYERFAVDISGDYNIYGEYNCVGTSVYPISYDAFENIINYNFKKIGFWDNDSGLCISIGSWLNCLTCTGFYPVITADEARAMLVSGDYVTTVPEEYVTNGITEDMIGHCELVYRQNEACDHYLPYYRFLVGIETHNDGIPEGLKHYGGFYVPAVRPEYIENVDTELRFN